MLISLYKCDNCGKILSEGGIGKPHISIKLRTYSGWVANEDGRWHYKTNKQGIFQFCSGLCLGQYFNKLKIMPKK